MRFLLPLIALILMTACSLQPIESGANTGEITITDAAPSSQISLADICQQKGYTYEADGTCVYRQESSETQPRMEIHYPIELIQSQFIENTIEQYLADYRMNFMQQFEDYADPNFAPWDLALGYTIYRHSPTIVSILYSEAFYTGGAHPGLTYESFTFDTGNQRILQFADLFVDGIDPVATLAPLVRPVIEEHLQGLGDTQQIINGTDELNDYRNFALSDTSLFIFIEPYQVAAGAAGAQTVEIPLVELAGSLRDL